MAGVIPGAAKKDDSEEAAAGDAVGPLREGAAQLERIPVRGLIWRHINHGNRVTRRDALCRMGNGFGMLAFASLVGESIVARGRRR